MGGFSRAIVAVFLLSSFGDFVRSVTYDDLEEMGATCPVRDSCRQMPQSTPFSSKNCECDSACHTYRDCCVDVRRRSSRTPATNLMCLDYGQDPHLGIYVVSKCSDDWNGQNKVKQKCEGSPDLSDPFSASPVSSNSGKVTYRNLFCAECNNADMDSLTFFQSRLSCEGLNGVSQEQIMEQLSYNKEKDAWGVNRVNAGGSTDFKECKITFDLPSYLEDSVRFCRSNVISTCARDWTQPQVRKACEEYTAVVYTRKSAYRNAHCAVCNHVTVAQIRCKPDLTTQKKTLTFDALIDVNRPDSNESKCLANSMYDPYFKRCRKLSCAIRGYVRSNGKCVPGR